MHAQLRENLHAQRLEGASISRLQKEAIEPVVELASSQRDCFREMKHVRSHDKARSMWVLKEYAHLFDAVD